MDPQQQFCLKWNSFGNNLVSTFENLFKSSSLTDVTLFCEGVTFQAHKLILAACSKHFQDLFESAPVCPSILVILDGTSSSNMSALLEFMYKGEVHVAQESLSSFLKAAEYLQVKGLSVEQEKLVTQTPSMNDVHLDVHQNSNRKHNKQYASSICGIKIEDGSANSRSLHVSDTEAMLPPSSNTSSSPYHYPYKGQIYERVVGTSNQSQNAYDLVPRKRHQRSPSDSNTMTRASVLRDGSKHERESPLSASCTPPIPSSGLALHFEPASSSLSHSSMSNEASNTPYGTAAVEKSPSPQTWHSSGTNCAEDLRMKCASVESGGSSSLDENGCDNRKFYTATVESSGDNVDRVSQHAHMDVVESSPSANSNAPTWNSTVCATPHKITTTTTPDGKKLQCPFCERLYGYETNLRAHIRQRHQGIRVPCPFCTRTFTRNNTVRRHIAREHKTELSLKALQQSQVPNHSQQPQ